MNITHEKTMKQTAVDWLKFQINSIQFQDPAAEELYLEIQPLIEQAKAMQKEQIFEAWDNGFANGYDLGKYNDECTPEDAEQYYNETYESKTNL